MRKTGVPNKCLVYTVRKSFKITDWSDHAVTLSEIVLLIYSIKQISAIWTKIKDYGTYRTTGKTAHLMQPSNSVYHILM